MDFERVGNQIRVPRAKKAEYLAAVADADAPQSEQLKSPRTVVTDGFVMRGFAAFHAAQRNVAVKIQLEQMPVDVWPTIREEAQERVIGEPLPIRLIGNDIHPGALSLARRNAELAEVDYSNSAIGTFIQSSTSTARVVQSPCTSRFRNNVR